MIKVMLENIFTESLFDLAEFMLYWVREYGYIKMARKAKDSLRNAPNLRVEWVSAEFTWLFLHYTDIQQMKETAQKWTSPLL